MLAMARRSGSVGSSETGMNRVATMNRGMENARALDTVEVPSLEGKVSAVQDRVKRRLRT